MEATPAKKCIHTPVSVFFCTHKDMQILQCTVKSHSPHLAYSDTWPPPVTLGNLRVVDCLQIITACFSHPLECHFLLVYSSLTSLASGPLNTSATREVWVGEALSHLAEKGFFFL